MRGILITIYVITISILLPCNGDHSNDSNVKPKVVERIVEKIYSITSEALKNASPGEKEEIMKKIENKLIKSAEAHGSKAEKYIKLIMQGLRVMANNQTRKQNLGMFGSVSNLRGADQNNTVINSAKNTAQDLADRLLKAVDQHFKKETRSGDNELKVMENIRLKVLETAKQRHDLIHIKHEEIKKYTDLISRGMESMIRNMTRDSNKRRMVMEFVKGNDRTVYANKDLNGNRNEMTYGDHDQNFVVVTEASENRYGLTTTMSCDDVFHKTCSDIKSLNEFACKDNGVTLSLNNLCNGVTDCEDGSDEGNCINHATERLQTATSLMSSIENFLLRNCFLSDDNSLLIKQNTVLYEVLQRQVGFINRYRNMNRNTLEFTNAYTFKRTLNEVIMVINTLALALDSSLCVRYMNEKQAELDSRKYNPLDDDDLDELNEKPIGRVSLKSCVCSGSFCANATCPEACSRVCWHKYNLGRWTCQAIDESTSVPLDMVCDGKLDCYDETDENDCKTGVSHAKFEANELFDKILKLITTKSNMQEYTEVKRKLNALANTIMELQRVTVKSRVDDHNIKNIRDICYASIVSVYEDIVSNAHDIKDLDDAHTFLLTVSERLMTALKQTHTGNDKIITQDGCYCRKDRCAALRCSPSCHRACAVNSKLTKYWCRNTINNISIPISALCNGIPNCPFKDDESHCIFDVCRKHHLILLRHNIRDVGEKQKGTALGEALRTWKSKVVSTLKIAENNYRPTPTTLRELVGDMLHDLVTMYASMDDTRRTNTEYVLTEFFEISQRMIEGVKACGQ